MLTTAELKRTLLTRQLLMERAAVTVPRALERMGCLQAQYAPSMYIGLWSRVQGLRREQVTTALERRTVVQGTLMRATIHLVSRRDYWPLAIAIRDRRRAWALRVTPGTPSEAAMRDAAEVLRDHLAGGPLRQREIQDLLGNVRAALVGAWLDLVRVPPSGTWERRRADLYDAAENWLGLPPDIGAADAQVHLVRRYLTGFGPATPVEIATWGGLAPADVDAALSRLKIRRVIADDGTTMVDLPRAPIAAPEGEPPVRFIPTWDAMLLVHARRKAILPEHYRSIIFSVKKPQSMPTFLVDGRVAGAWKFADGRVHLEPFEPLDPGTMKELEREAEALAAFHR